MSKKRVHLDMLYGMLVVPNFNCYDNDGSPFEGFHGIVVECDPKMENIRITRVAKDEESRSYKLTNAECTEHGKDRGGKEFAEYLYAKAKDFSKENEEIAVTERLAWHLLDCELCWKREKKG